MAFLSYPRIFVLAVIFTSSYNAFADYGRVISGSLCGSQQNGGSDSVSNTDPNDGTPYTPPPTDDGTDTNNSTTFTNLIGFKSMRYCEGNCDDSGDDWENEGDTARFAGTDAIPSKISFRMKMTRKNDVWPSQQMCGWIYFSHNNRFDIDSDQRISGKVCRSFDHSTDLRSLYIPNVSTPSGMKEGNDYYFFTYIIDENGRELEISSENTNEEYVKFDILQPQYDVSVNSLTYNIPEPVKTGDIFTVTALVRNNGHHTNDDVEVKAWFNDYEQVKNLGRMSSGQEKTASFSFEVPYRSGTYEVVALADPNGRIHETNSANNTMRVNVNIKRKVPSIAGVLHILFADDETYLNQNADPVTPTCANKLYENTETFTGITLVGCDSVIFRPGIDQTIRILPTTTVRTEN